MGVTQQMLGAGGSPFAYRGSIGPWPIGDGLAVKLCRIGEAVSAESGLLGWFGVDYVLRGDDPWPVEINPRYTASVEIHELATGRALLCEHRIACEGVGDRNGATVPVREKSGRPRMIAKLIMYASGDLVAPLMPFEGDAPSEPFALRPIADVPWPGTAIAAGQPLMTIFASGEDEAECRSRLSALEREWGERLGTTWEK